LDVFWEQGLYTHKSRVRNRACPVGSMAEGYIADEYDTLFKIFSWDSNKI